MTQGSNFWVIGGEFGSMNFHKLVEGSAQVQGPFKTRKEAEDAWRVVSEENRHKAGVRFSIVEEPSRVPASSIRRRPRTKAVPSGYPGGAAFVFPLRHFLPPRPAPCGERHRRPLAAVLDRRTPMRSIGYGEGLSPRRDFELWSAPCLAPHPKFATANFDLSRKRAGRGKKPKA